MNPSQIHCWICRNINLVPLCLSWIWCVDVFCYHGISFVINAEW